MVNVDKKYIKLGAAGLAVAALVIGLSVGLTRNNSSNANNAASSSAYGNENIASDFDEDMIAYCSPSSSGKSGKSGGESGGGKSGKSGGGGSMDDGIARRLLVVPGTEDYAAEQQLQVGDKSVRRALRNELVRELQTTNSGKSGKSGNSNSVTSDDTIVCRKPKDICGEPQYSFTSDDSSSSAGKSGKSGGDGDGKSGKSGGDMSMMGSGKSGKSGGESGDSGKSGKSGYGSYDYGSSCGKAGKSGGGGKAGKSGSGDNSFSSGSSGSTSGKAGKSGTYDSEDCPSIAPTVCEPTETYMPTYMPTECICEDQAWYIDVISLTCVRGCDINCDALPPYPASGGGETCRERGFSSNSNCREDCTSLFARDGQECTTDDSICTPEPETTPRPTPSPTQGSTPTVSTEQTGPPTKSAPV